MITLKARNYYAQIAYDAALQAMAAAKEAGYTPNYSFEDKNSKIRFLQLIQSYCPFKNAPPERKGELYQVWARQRDIAIRWKCPNYFEDGSWGVRYEQLSLFD